MTKYYLLSGNAFVGEVDAGQAGLTALQLLNGPSGYSLIQESLINNLMTNLGLTPAQVATAMGLSYMPITPINAIFVTPQIVSLHTQINGPAYEIAAIGTYNLYQVITDQANAVALHNELWAMAPAQTLGCLAVVQTFGSSFYPTAMQTAVGLTPAQELTRRNTIATYLDSLGKNTTALRAATDENTQMQAIVVALGYTMAQCWAAMVAS